MAIGNPVSTTSSSVASKTSSVIATAGQTLFTVPAGYVTNHISVFRNGIRLVDGRDYEARNGATVTLLAAATVGDVIEFHVFDTFSVADAVTNQGGTIFGDLTVEGSIGDITANNVTGVAATFTGAVSVGGVLTYEDVTNIDSVGIITARSDLSIADKIIHTGDTNTAIRFPAADTVTIETTGTERLRIDSSGTIKIGGIGQLALDISYDGSSATAAKIVTNTGVTNANSTLTFAVNENSGAQLQLKGDGAAVFSEGSTERMRIDSSGKLRVGNVSGAVTSGDLEVTPTSGSATVVVGRLSSTSNDNTSFRVRDRLDNTLLSSSASLPLQVGRNGSEFARIDTSGRLLLGTTTEGQSNADNLTIADSSRAGITIRSGQNEFGSIYFSDSTSGAGEYDGILQYNHADQALIFATASTVRLRIDSSGRLLLGTTTEGQTNADNFTVAENGHCGITIRSSNTTTGNLFFSDATSGTAEYAGAIVYDHSTDSLELYSGGGIERMRLDSSGRLLIGKTSGAYEIDIGGVSNAQIRCDGLTNSGQRGLIYAYNGTNFGSTGLNVQTGELRIRSGESGQTGYFITFGTGGTERMRIKSDGTLHAIKSGTQITNAEQTVAVFQRSSAPGTTSKISIVSGNGASSHINFGDTDDEDVGQIIYDHSNNSMQFLTNANERLRIDSSGRFGLGTSSPGAKLTVQDGANAAGAILVGANYDSTGLTNNQTKLAPIHMPHYTNAEESIRLIAGYSDASQSIVSIGGGTASANSVTKVQIFTAANTTTTAGTAAITVDSSQRVGVGIAFPGTNLHVVSSGATEIKSESTGDNALISINNSSSVPWLLTQRSDTSNSLSFRYNGNNYVNIDTSGRVLIGRSSSGNVGSGAASTVQIQNALGFHIGCVATQDSGGAGGIAIGKSRNGGIVQSGDDLGSIVFAGHDGVDLQTRAAAIEVEVDGTPGSNDMPGRILFKTTADGSNSPTERMRITSGGEVKISHSNTSANLLFLHNTDTSGGTRLSVIKGGTTNSSDVTTRLISFERNDGTEIGKIRRGGFSSIAFDTSSDYRIKSNIVSLAGAIERVKQFNPVRFNWIEDTSTTPTVLDGFLAHEVQTVVPEAVSGYKDQVDDDGNPVIQGLDQSKLVPLLTAALQEAIAKIETLESEVAALKAS